MAFMLCTIRTLSGYEDKPTYPSEKCYRSELQSQFSNARVIKWRLEHSKGEHSAHSETKAVIDTETDGQ